MFNKCQFIKLFYQNRNMRKNKFYIDFVLNLFNINKSKIKIDELKTFLKIQPKNIYEIRHFQGQNQSKKRPFFIKIIQ